MRTDTTRAHHRPTHRIVLALAAVLALALISGVSPQRADAAVTVGAAAAAPIPNAPTPVIQGTGRVGDVLTAVPGTWPPGTTLTYLWFADGRPVAQVPAKTFTPRTAHIGMRVTVRVVGVKTGYAITTKVSAPTAPITTGVTPPAAPVVATTVADAESRSISVAWRPTRDGGSPITGWIVTRGGDDASGGGPARITLPADARSYVFEDLIPQRLYFITVAAVNAVGTGGAAETTGNVPPRSMQRGTPVILGTPTPLSILTADKGIWVPEDATFTYTWWIDNRPLFGWNEPWLYVDPRYVGSQVWVVVEAESYPFWVTGVAMSEPVVIVEGPPGD